MTSKFPRLIKYLIGSSMALVAISNCFNVLSNSTLFVIPMSPEAPRVESIRSEAQLTRSASVGASGNPILNPANTKSTILPGRLRNASLGSPFAPNITATLADSLQVDNNNSGKAEPGDTLMYTVTITNSGTDATGVVFTDDLSQNGGNLTLVAGSVNSSPVAVNDSYPNGVGNTRLTVNVANGVLTNDFDPDGTTPTAVAITNGATTNGGTVTLLADGSFTYDPPVGFTGTDTFTYTATDGSKTDTATVTITLTSRVWYVDNTFTGTTSDGRSATPFKTLTPVNGASDADAPGDIIYVVENGGGSYTGGLALENNEQLIGNGVALVVNSQTLRPAGSKPTITNSGGNGVTLAQGNTVRGLIAQTTASGGASAGIAGSSVGNLSMDTLQAVGNPGAAVDIQTAGTLAVTLESLSSTNGTRGVRLTSPTGGTFAVSGSTTISGTTGDGVILTGGGSQTTNFTGALSITTASGRGIVANAAGTLNVSTASSTIDATGGAALDLTSMNLGTGLLFTSLKSTNSTAEGIKTQGCIQNITATTTNIQTPTGNGVDIQNTFGTSTFNFGNTTVNKTSAGTGVNLNSNGTATVAFGALNITAGNGSGLVAGTSGIVNSTSGTISATNGPALNLSSVTAGLTLTSVSSTNSSTTGINLTSVGGSLSIGTTTTTNPTGIGINATSNSASLNFGNTTANTSGGTGVVLGGSGVGNTGTITFGDLDIAPDAGQRGLLAQENSNTITTTSGTISNTMASAIEITRSSGTTPLNITLTSVSSSGGTASGIILQNTSGSFTINGDGTNTAVGGNGTGGTIANKDDGGTDGVGTVGTGVFLNNAQNITLRRMTINGTNANYGIRGTSVTGVTIQYCTVGGTEGDSTGADEGSIIFDGLFGTSTFTNLSVSGTVEDNFRVRNSSGTANDIVITGSTFTNAPNDNIIFEPSGTSTVTAHVTNNTFTGAGGDHLQTATTNSATMTIVFTGNFFSNGLAGSLGGGVTISGGNAGSSEHCNFNISNNGSAANPLIGTVQGGTININEGNGAGTWQGQVSNNFIGNNTAGSGGSQSSCIRVENHSPSGSLKAIVSGNTVKSWGTGAAINFQVGDTGNVNASLDLTVTGNTVSNPGTLTQHGVVGNFGADANGTNAVCFDFKTNNVNLGGTPPNGGADLRLRQRNGSTVRLPGYAGGNTDATAVANFIKGQNTLSDAGNEVSVQVNSPPGGGYVGGAACASPVVPTRVEPGDATASSMSTSSIAHETGDDSESALRTAHGEGPYDSNLRELTQAELDWMVQAAIARWTAVGISAEDLARLQGVVFEVDDLPYSELARGNGIHVRIDKKAAGYGWFFDQSPPEDGEFQVPVYGKELQTTELSPAHGKMDLLTVVMRELGQVYQQGKARLPKTMRKNLLPMIEGTLSPGVRRLPLNIWNVTPPSTTGLLTPSATPNKVVGQTQTGASLPTGDVIRALVTALGYQPSWQAGSAASTILEPIDYVLTHWKSATVEAATLTSEPAPAGPYVPESVMNAPGRDEAALQSASLSEAKLSIAAPSPADRLGSLRPAVTRPQDVAVMGIHESSDEAEDMPVLRPVAMTTQKQKAGGKKTFAPTAVTSGGIVSVGPFNLPAGETVTIMFSATIDTPVTPAGTTQVCTRGTVTANGGINVQTTDPGPPIVNGATCTTLAQADLAVTKSDSPDPVTTGSNITYTINLTNNGPDSAYNVKVTDATPANTTFVSATPPVGWAVTGSPAVGATGNVVFQKSPAGPVANAATAQFQIVVQVDAATPGGTIITNNAVATSDTPDGTQANNTGTATTTAQSQADLAVTKSDSPDPVLAGNNITYTINFVNNGPGSATSVTVTDAVPANTTFVSATVTTGSGWSTSSPAVGGTGNVVFSKAAVPNAETAVFTIVVKVNSSTASGATITNSVSAAPTSSDPDTSNNTATATTTVNTQADIEILSKNDSPDPVNAGANLQYTIVFRNSGPSDAQSVTITDVLPPETTFVSLAGVGGPFTGSTTPAVGANGTVTISAPSVPANPITSYNFILTVKVNSNTASGATITNTASATTTTTDPDTSNNSKTATTSVTTAADLAVTKSDSPDPVTAGNNLTYTINFTNAGPSDAQAVTVTDAVPANTTFVSAVVTTGIGWSASAPAVGGTGNVVFSKATVVAGETAVFTIVVNVNSNTANGTTLSNSAIAASATIDSTPANNTGTATTTVSAMADLAVTKTDSPDPVFAGSDITYTINFVNNGPSDAQSVTVTDAMPANTTFVSASVTTGTGWSTSSPAVGGTGNVVFSKASVAAGETAVFTIVVKVNSSTAAATVISNSATAASTTTDPTPGNNTGTATTTVQAQADLSLTKTGSPTPSVVAGNNLTYTINFNNNGPSDAPSVTVTDPVPANTTFISATVTTGTGWSTSAPAVGGTGNVVFSKASVAAGETAVFTIVVHVNANTANGATITNTATAASTSTDPSSGNNTATAMTMVTTSADLAVTKSDSPDPVIAGNNLTYTINFVNNGPSVAQNVFVGDAIGAFTTFFSASVTTGTGWSLSTPPVGSVGTVSFSKSIVASEETAVFTIVVKVNSNVPSGGTITNTVGITSDTNDPLQGNNNASSTTTVQTQADLAVTKSDSPDPVFAGNNITYTINFNNAGPSDAQTVTVTDAVPANATFVSATVTTGSGWSNSAPAVGGTGNVVFSKATAAAAESAVFTIVVKVNANTASGTTITNSATASSASTDPTSGNNTATATSTVMTQADLALTKSDSPDPVVASQNLTYTLNFVNNGPSNAQSVTITDPLPANTTFVSAMVTTGSGWSTSAPPVGGTGDVVFSKPTATAGETAVFTIVVNVNASTPNNTTLTNSATAATNTTDPTPGNNTGTASTTVLAQADLALTKTDSPDPACVGGNITYTINFVDNGPGPGINTTVTDPVPANTTFVSASVISGTGWSISSPAVGGTGNVVFSKSSTASGETAVLQVVVKVSEGVMHGTVITNSATAASSIPDPMPVNNTATATSTVDPIPPTIACPANVIGATNQAACQQGGCATVNFTAPMATDNCSGVVVVCSPPSGSCMPAGSTTVTCTATDAAGNTASCAFTVTVFDVCIQDDSNPNTVLLFNSQTGEYKFCCGGTTYTGTGTVTVRGCMISLAHTAGDRRVSASVDKTQFKGSGYLQSPPGVFKCTITDRDIRNNACNCT